MAGVEVIEREDQLPKVGAAMETIARDFKQLWEGGLPKDRVDVATDVAAFANRIGGAIIIGAFEDRSRRVLGTYEPFDAAAAKVVLDACDLAVRDLCFPKLSVKHWNRLLGGALYAAQPRVDWASLLRRCFDVDVLACQSCGGRLRVLGEVTEPAMVRLVLESLGMPADAPRVARARDPTALVGEHVGA